MSREAVTSLVLAFLAGQDAARATLAAIQAGTADVDTLYLALARLPAEQLRGFARQVQKCIERGAL
jgi:hypothetical protein